MKTHELKCWPIHYDEIAAGRKTFEYRIDDREYDVGHLLHLRRFQPIDQRYTGESMTVKVTNILRDGHSLPEGLVIMSIAALAPPPVAGEPCDVVMGCARTYAYEFSKGDVRLINAAYVRLQNAVAAITPSKQEGA